MYRRKTDLIEKLAPVFGTEPAIQSTSLFNIAPRPCSAGEPVELKALIV